MSTLQSIEDNSPRTPVEEAEARSRALFWISAIAVLVVVGIYILDRYAPNRPVKFNSIEEHFKYGSIGSDIENGLPLEIMLVLPNLFPEYLPKGASRDYTAFGFHQEDGHRLPIGFSQRRVGIDRTGMNCAACHTGAYRTSPDSKSELLLAMPSNTVNVQGFFTFLFRCAEDERFTPEYIVPALKKNTSWLPIVDDFIYSSAVTQMRGGILLKDAEFSAFLTPDHPLWGPGRVDTFNPYKVVQFSSYYHHDITQAEVYGTADFPSIWNQKPREGMHLHWDGNNTSIKERNISAALGAGATRENVDIPSIDRVRVWLEGMEAPKCPYQTAANVPQVKRGQIVFEQHCASCHAFGGADVGKVEPVGSVQTDVGRLNSYTETLRNLQVDYTSPYPWAFKHFEKTQGYANQPLDGIWARAPYLHNGSVPTISDLLKPASDRPKVFYIGHGVIDSQNVGFRSDVDKIEDRPMFLYDTRLPGNGNEGHSGSQFGTDLPPEDKQDLIEYMKTL